MTFQNKLINCRDCRQEFTFTSAEQAFLAAKLLLDTEPRRCPNCRLAATKQQGQILPDCGELSCQTCGLVTSNLFKVTGPIPKYYCARCMAGGGKKGQTDDGKIG